MAKVTDYDLNTEEYKIMLSELLVHAHTRLDKLEKSTLKTFTDAYEMAKYSISLGKQQKVEEAINCTFGNIQLDTIQPSTVAATFIGCRIGACTGVPIACSPYCANSFGSQNANGWKQCEKTVITFDGKKFTNIITGSLEKDTAYIYVNFEFKGFTRAHIVHLMDVLKITKVQVIQQVGKTCKRYNESFVHLEALVLPNEPVTMTVTTSTSNWNWLWWIVGLVVAIIIVAAILGAIFWSNKKKTTEISMKSPSLMSSDYGNV